jgi:Fic family protein
MINKRLNIISELLKEYHTLKRKSGSLPSLVDEVEISEQVYNSNAIENSTLTLSETEQILLQLEISRHVSLRELFEAKNLALVFEYVKNIAIEKPITIEIILLLHKMLLTNIRDNVAGRFRKDNEMVRVGDHIGIPPEFIEQRMCESIDEFNSDLTMPYLYKIARFHCQFESMHPFIDGNGRIGRVINNYFLLRAGFPPIIIRNKEKQKYYAAIRSYDDSHTFDLMARVFELAMLESLHKRLAYLKYLRIIPLHKFAATQTKSDNTLLNAARRQTIPAFREKGIWKIGVEQ